MRSLKGCELNMAGNYCVYKHTLPKNVSGKANEMIYIGITKLNPERRWRKGNGYENNRYFWNAIQKYGWKTFQHEILFDNLSRDEASLMEKELISFYNSSDRKFGYNLQTGGVSDYEYSASARERMGRARKEFLSSHTHPFSGTTMSDETKKKISDSQKKRFAENPELLQKLRNKKMSDDQKQRLSKAAKDRLSNPENNPFYGKHHSEEAKAALSKMAKDRLKNPKNNPNYGNTKKVICLDTSVVYSSVEEVSKEFGLSKSALYRNCTGKTDRCGGLCFRYLDFADKEVS